MQGELAWEPSCVKTYDAEKSCGCDHVQRKYHKENHANTECIWENCVGETVGAS